MKSESNIIESVEFLAEEDLLVAELDRRLSFTAVLTAGSKNNDGVYGSLCDCILKKIETRPGNMPSAVRG